MHATGNCARVARIVLVYMTVIIMKVFIVETILVYNMTVCLTYRVHADLRACVH